MKLKKGLRFFMLLQMIMIMTIFISAQVSACSSSSHSCSSKVKYTVYYKDYMTKANLLSPVSKYVAKNTTVKEYAKTISGYSVVGASSKSLKVQKCKCNTIIFYYEKQPELTSYEVRYLEENTNAEVAPAKTVNDQVVGTEVTETALNVAGYDLVSANTQSLVLGESDNVIIFYYRAAKKLASYTVYYVDLDTGKELWESKTVSGLEVGQTITEYAIVITGYTPMQAEKTFTLNDTGNYVYFIYYSSVAYSENESENVIEAEAADGSAETEAHIEEAIETKVQAEAVEVQEAPAETETIEVQEAPTETEAAEVQEAPAEPEAAEVQEAPAE